jgi:hypothetical protein
MNDNNDNHLQSSKTNPPDENVSNEEEKSLPRSTDIQILKPNPNALPPKPEDIM